MHDLIQSQIVGDSSIFGWPYRFHKKIAEFYEWGKLDAPKWSGFNVSTEFSGSGCAEAAFVASARAAGYEPQQVNFRYAADIDKNCRKVIAESCPCFSCQ